MSGVPEGGVDERAGRWMPGQAAQAAQASSGCCACLHSALNALRSACSTRGEHHWKALAACTQGDYLQPAVRRLKPY